MSSEDAHKRAIEDYSQYSQYARASAQFAFAANGGAALAMLSFLTAIATANHANPAISIDTVVRSFAYAAAFYLCGVLLSTLAMYAMSLSKQYWGHFWEDIALGGTADFKSSFARRGERLNKIGVSLLVMAAAAFVPGSAFAVLGFIGK